MWSSPTSTHPQITKTLTSTWPMMSPHQTMWQRNMQKSHPRRCDLTLWCKFTVEMRVKIRQYIISAVEKCYILYKITYFQVIVLQTKWKKFNNQGEFDVALDALLVRVSKELSHFRPGMVENQWIRFLRVPSSSEKRLLAAWWTLRGKLEWCVTQSLSGYSAFVLDHNMYFLLGSVWLRWLRRTY